MGLVWYLFFMLSQVSSFILVTFRSCLESVRAPAKIVGWWNQVASTPIFTPRARIREGWRGHCGACAYHHTALVHVLEVGRIRAHPQKYPRCGGKFFLHKDIRIFSIPILEGQAINIKDSVVIPSSHQLKWICKHFCWCYSKTQNMVKWPLMDDRMGISVEDLMLQVLNGNWQQFLFGKATHYTSLTFTPTLLSIWQTFGNHWKDVKLIGVGWISCLLSKTQEKATFSPGAKLLASTTCQRRSHEAQGVPRFTQRCLEVLGFGKLTNNGNQFQFPDQQFHAEPPSKLRFVLKIHTF